MEVNFKKTSKCVFCRIYIIRGVIRPSISKMLNVQESQKTWLPLITLMNGTAFFLPCHNGSIFSYWNLKKERKKKKKLKKKFSLKSLKLSYKVLSSHWWYTLCICLHQLQFPFAEILQKLALKWLISIAVARSNSHYNVTMKCHSTYSVNNIL